MLLGACHVPERLCGGLDYLGRYNNVHLCLFSRSYCYTVWSAIVISMSSVCLSVCLWHCALWLSRSVYRA